MNTLQEEDFSVLPTIRKMELKGLTPLRSEFRVRLRCRSLDTYGWFPFYIDLCDDEELEVNIEMDEAIPIGQVPRFLIDSHCIKNNDGKPEELWAGLASNAIVMFTETKVILEKKGLRLIATVHINAFRAKGKVPMAKVKKFFK